MRDGRLERARGGPAHGNGQIEPKAGKNNQRSGAGRGKNLGEIKRFGPDNVDYFPGRGNRRSRPNGLASWWPDRLVNFLAMDTHIRGRLDADSDLVTRDP